MQTFSVCMCRLLQTPMEGNKRRDFGAKREERRDDAVRRCQERYRALLYARPRQTGAKLDSDSKDVVLLSSKFCYYILWCVKVIWCGLYYYKKASEYCLKAFLHRLSLIEILLNADCLYSFPSLEAIRVATNFQNLPPWRLSISRRICLVGLISSGTALINLFARWLPGSYLNSRVLGGLAPRDRATGRAENRAAEN